jgi:hypothetical protein
MSEYEGGQSKNLLVTDAVLLTGAIARQVAELAAVVALGTLGAVTGKVTWRSHHVSNQN